MGLARTVCNIRSKLIKMIISSIWRRTTKKKRRIKIENRSKWIIIKWSFPTFEEQEKRKRIKIKNKLFIEILKESKKDFKRCSQERRPKKGSDKKLKNKTEKKTKKQKNKRIYIFLNGVKLNTGRQILPLTLKPSKNSLIPLNHCDILNKEKGKLKSKGKRINEWS